MKTMKAVVYDEPAKFEVRKVAVPEPGPGEVLIRVLAAGVCGTDLHLHAGEFGPTYPLTPGHEFVGVAVSVGTGVGEDMIGAASSSTTLVPAGDAWNAVEPDRPIATIWLRRASMRLGASPNTW